MSHMAEMAMLTCVQPSEQSLSLWPRLAFPSCCGIQVFCVFFDVAANDGLHSAKWLPLRVQFYMFLHACAPAGFFVLVADANFHPHHCLQPPSLKCQSGSSTLGCAKHAFINTKPYLCSHTMCALQSRNPFIGIARRSPTELITADDI